MNDTIYEYKNEIYELKFIKTRLDDSLMNKLTELYNINVFLHPESYVRDVCTRLFSRYLNNVDTVIVIYYYDEDLLMDTVTMYVTLSGIYVNYEYSEVLGYIMQGIVNILNNER
jgi:hypothetical protein